MSNESNTAPSRITPTYADECRDEWMVCIIVILAVSILEGWMTGSSLLGVIFFLAMGAIYAHAEWERYVRHLRKQILSEIQNQPTVRCNNVSFDRKIKYF